MAKFKKDQYIPPDAPLLYEDHGRPMSRRQFIRQGLMTGSASILTGGIFGLFANPNAAHAAISGDLASLAADITAKGNFNCSVGGLAAGQKVPFICFDLAGGANLAGSNVLVGQGGGQMDLLSTAGYSKLGIPGDMIPGLDDTGVTLLNPSNGDFTNSELNLMFHADSAMLRGIRDTALTAFAGSNVDGCVIPARSDNDTGNNPHNPLYGLAMTGARGDVVDLIGSRTSVSGGNSMAPASQINPEFRPTKVDRASDVTGMVDIGELTSILDGGDVTAVMESIARVTHRKLKLAQVDTLLNTPLDPTRDEIVKDMVRCGYLKSADIADRFAGEVVDPLEDLAIQSIFSTVGGFNDSEFRKTASVMKMVLNGYAAGGCITMGGYDYHTGDRRTGENRDLRAGRCIGACLEYARRLDTPLMIYVFSDGSVFSNGNSDDSQNAGDGDTLQLGGAGKGQWTGDNSSTACSYFLVFDPDGPPTLVGSRQIGQMNAGASVVTSANPAANNPNLLVNMLLLNYMAVNGNAGGIDGVISEFKSIFPNHGLGSDASLASYIAFDAL